MVMSRQLTFEVTIDQMEIKDIVGGIVNVGNSRQRRVGKRDPNVQRFLSRAPDARRPPGGARGNREGTR